MSIYPYPDTPTLAGLMTWGRKLVKVLNDLAGQGSSGTSSSSSAGGLAFPGAGAICFGSVPPGWLACNGAVLKQAGQPLLFKAIGTKYNTGGEAGDEFRLPDASDKVPKHSADAYGGSSEVTLTQAMLPNYALPVTDPTHRHDVIGTPMLGGAPTSVGGGVVAAVVGAAGEIAVDYASTGISVHSGGSGDAVPIPAQPFFGVTFIIKT